MKPILVLVAAALLAATTASRAHAEVVYGNLGVSGTEGVGNGGFVVLSDNHAQGFRASAPNLDVQSVSMWLGTPASTTASVTIYSDSASQPGSLLYTSNTQLVNQTQAALYQFTFSGASLVSGATYWIIPEFTRGTTLHWFDRSAAPTAQNSSGYSYVDTLRQSGSSWSFSSDTNLTVSVSAASTPEIDPAGFVSVAALLTGALGLVERWQRKAKSA